jgi:hypothetical protein
LLFGSPREWLDDLVSALPLPDAAFAGGAHPGTTFSTVSRLE